MLDFARRPDIQRSRRKFDSAFQSHTRILVFVETSTGASSKGQTKPVPIVTHVPLQHPDIQIIEWLYHATKASHESSKTGSPIHLSINLTRLYDRALPLIDPEDFHRSTKLSTQHFMTTPILSLTRDGAVWRDTTAATPHDSSLGSTDHTKSTSTLSPDRLRQMWTRATKFLHIVKCEA